MLEREISLEEAVQRFTPTLYCTWFTSGDIINQKTAKNGCVSRIGIFWSVEKSDFSVTLSTHTAESKLSILRLGNFSSLNELKQIFPQFFKVTGILNVL